MRMLDKKKNSGPNGPLFTDVISKLVQYLQLVLHEIRAEVARWRIILAVPYQEYLMGK